MAGVTSISLKKHLIRSWLLLGVGALLSSIAVLSLLVFVEFNHQRSRLADDLHRKAAQIARSLSGELLIGADGAPDAVIPELRRFHEIPYIELLPATLSCMDANSQTPECSARTRGHIWVVEPLPSLSERREVIVGVPEPLLSQSFNWRLVLMGAVPLLLMSGIGIFLQWRFLRTRLLGPLDTIVDTEGNEGGSSLWPTELRKVSERLRTLLAERDRALAVSHHLRAQSLVGDFVEGVLHDIQTPLVTAGILLDDSPGLSVSRRDQIKGLLNRVRETIKDHRKRVDRQSQEPLPVQDELASRHDAFASVGGAVGSMIREFRPVSEKGGVELVASIPRAAYSQFVPLSLAEVSRVLANLLDNAIHESSQGGKRVIVSAILAPSRCEISIRDYGRGFSPEILSRLEAGEQVTTKSKGNGIGLISTRSLIQKANGELCISNLPDGSLVRVMLPIVPPPSWFQDVTRARADHIVALDDDLTMEARLAEVFPNKNVTMTRTESEFLAEARRSSSALLLVDHNYGGTRDGLRLILDEKLSERAVLFSGRISFDETLRVTAEQAGVRLCPKECLVWE